MFTVFIFAKLWRRAGVMTDVEFYELRYSGPSAAFLRGFRALYLSLVFNVLIMGMVSLAAIKFGEIVLGIEGWKMLLGSGLIIAIYSSIGGLRGVILTDFVQFSLAMLGSIWAAVYLVNHEKIGGLGSLLSHERVVEKMAIFPDFGKPEIWIPIILVPLAVQWWSSYFPGAEPGGGGYVAQRMFSAKNERHAIGGTLLFNIAHYALRPWPWILISLASLVVFKDLDSIRAAFPNVDPSLIENDAAYPAMLTLLPAGLIGLVVASLLAAFMSTMSTQVNLGASYLVNDFYRRFMRPEASEKELVRVGRIATILMLVMGSGLALVLTNVQQAVNYLLLLGAGTGAVFILRWFWWRVNAATEIIAMIISLIVASFFTFSVDPAIADWTPLDRVMMLKVLPVILTTFGWVITAFLTTPTSQETLIKFYQKVQPGGPGWNAVRKAAAKEGIDLTGGEKKWDVPVGMLCAVFGSLTVYGLLFTSGSIIYGRSTEAMAFGVGTLICGVILVKCWNLISSNVR